jgi:hypothetical protein
MKQQTSKLEKLLRTDDRHTRSLFVDPGLGGTGWAYFPTMPGAPKKWGVLNERIKADSGDWYSRAFRLAEKFERVLDEFEPNVVVLEMGELWAGSEVSVTSGKRGDLLKLVFLIGVLSEVCHKNDYRVVLVTPNEWKGNLPKEVVAARCEAQFGFTVGNHEQDAIGMGLSAQGAL